MPIYEFKCENCNKIFDELIQSSNIGNVYCPYCSNVHVHRLMSSFGFSSSSASSFSSADSSCSTCATRNCATCK